MKRSILFAAFVLFYFMLVATPSFAGPHTITYFEDNKAGALTLAFDDGYPSQVTTGVDQMNARGLRGTFFLVTGTGYVPWATWQALAGQGYEIGSHTVTHPELIGLPPADLAYQLAASQSAINENVPSQSCISLAYPYGDSDATVQAAAANYYVAARGTTVPEGGVINYYEAGSDAYGSWLAANFYNIGSRGIYEAIPLDSLDYDLELAVRRHGWIALHIHEISDGSAFGRILDLILTKDLWVAPFGDIALYMKERLSSQIAVLSETSTEIRLRLTHSLDPELYDYPLTVRSTVPSSWAQVKVQQGSFTETLTPVAENGESVIYYSAVPNGAEIILSDATPPQHGILYVSSNPTNWIDKNEYIALISPKGSVLRYLTATYDYYTNQDGWANPDGMTFVGSRLFITGFIPGTGNPRGIWEINPANGQEMGYFATALGRPRGLASDGKDLYVSQYYGYIYTIYKFSTSGKLLSSFNVPADMYGLAYGRGYLFASYRNILYKISPTTKQIVGQFSLPWNVVGLDFVEGTTPYLLASVPYVNVVYRISLNSSLNPAGTSSFRSIPAGYNSSVSYLP